MASKLYENLKAGKQQSEKDQELTGKYLGQAQWLAQTTHPTIAPAISMLSSIVKRNVEGGLDAMIHVMKYLKGKQAFALVRKAGVQSGLQAQSDADWAGMYTLSKGMEMRSRTGILITYNDMPVTWKSHYQQCKGTFYDEGKDYDEYLIATSSAESEVHAAADAAKEVKHLRYVAEELELNLPKKTDIKIDAGAAMGFIHNTGTVGRMKHIDVRCSWVQTLRDDSDINFVKIAGTDNKADFFTKIQPTTAFQGFEAVMMCPLPK